MKKVLTFTIIISLFMIGCNSQSKKEKELLEKEIDPISVNEADHKTDQPTIEQNYLLLSNSVGKFKIGSPIPFPETSDDYKIKKETQTRMTEEGPEEETIYVVSRNGKEMLHLKQEYDYETGQDSKNIGEIFVISPDIKTPEGIGVNSTIEDFVNYYPNFNLWYSYVGGMYVIENEDAKFQFILNKNDFIGKLEITSEVTTLKKSDFKEGAKILTIRIF